jgi:hypothetical protein
MAISQKPQRRISKKYVKEKIEHAKNMCHTFEDTIECRLAWETVEEIMHAYYDQETMAKKRHADLERDEPLENRIYDV